MIKKVKSIIAGLSGKSGDDINGLILRGGLVSLAVRCTGIIIGLISHLILSRLLGVNDYGIYAILIGWCMILAVPVKFGLDQTALKYGAIYLGEGRLRQFKSLIKFSSLILSAAWVIVAIIGGLIFLFLPNVFGTSRGVDFIWALSLVGLLAFIGLFSAYFRAAKMIFASQFFAQMLRTSLLVTLLVIFIVLGKELNVSGAIMITALAAAITFIALLFFFHRTFTKTWSNIASQNNDLLPKEHIKWVALGGPVLVIAIVQQAMSQGNVILVGALGSHSDAGRYAAAARLAAFVPFALVALNSITAPMIASAYKNNNHLELRKIASTNARLATIAALLVGAVLLIFGKAILSLFGDGFQEAYPALVLLLLAGILNAGVGSVGFFMTMTGFQTVSMKIVLVSFGLNIIAAITLIPSLGLLGGAIAAFLGIVSFNVMQYIFVFKKMRIDTSVFGMKL